MGKKKQLFTSLFLVLIFVLVLEINHETSLENGGNISLYVLHVLFLRKSFSPLETRRHAKHYCIHYLDIRRFNFKI